MKPRFWIETLLYFNSYFILAPFLMQHVFTKKESGPLRPIPFSLRTTGEKADILSSEIIIPKFMAKTKQAISLPVSKEG